MLKKVLVGDELISMEGYQSFISAEEMGRKLL